MPISRQPPCGSPARSDLERAAHFWDVRAGGADAECRHWLESGQACARVNALVTGDPHTYPLTAFAEAFRGCLPVARALSVGCGTGDLERQAVRANLAAHIDGIDISAAALDRARRSARMDGAAAAERITYHLADAESWLPAVEPGRYQLIFFHGSLHHIAALETVIAACARILRAGPPGLLYVDEYVGPARDQWCETDLTRAREFFARLPAEHRRTPELMQPMDPGDPSEMVRSAEIEPILRAHFQVLKYRPYYGNVVYPLLSALKGTSFSHPAVEQVVGDAMAREDSLVEAGSLRPLFALFIGRPRSEQEAAARQEKPPACPEVELDLRRLIAQRGAEQRALYAEIGRLNARIREMESTRAWRLHRWFERHVRAPTRRAMRAMRAMRARRPAAAPDEVG